MNNPVGSTPVHLPGSGPGTLSARFWGEWAGDGAPEKGEALLVALSGGLDSLCLLHLLRFSSAGLPPQLFAAHFDHRMRPESRKDAFWVRGLCRAWGVPLTMGEAEVPPTSEEGARESRYRFLERVRDQVGAFWLLTGHHADDQAETVLFRILRGTGLNGIGGIPRSRSPGIFRPLLGFSRQELNVYASQVKIRPREDPSNRDPRTPRNYIRHVALPGLEEWVAPGARKNLVRLARLARENEVAWGSLIPTILDGMTEVEERGLFIVRSTLLAYHPSVQIRLLRELVRRQGVNLDEAGTRAVLEFTRTGASGRAVSLPAGLRLTREFDRFLLGGQGDSPREVPLEIPSESVGDGKLVVGGREFDVAWGPSLKRNTEETLGISPEEVQFPLFLRGWNPGDKIRLSYGSKKLKKLFREADVALGDRDRTPVLVDVSGRVIWVVGVVAVEGTEGGGGRAPFFIGINYVNHR